MFNFLFKQKEKQLRKIFVKFSLYFYSLAELQVLQKWINTAVKEKIKKGYLQEECYDPDFYIDPESLRKK